MREKNVISRNRVVEKLASMSGVTKEQAASFYDDFKDSDDIENNERIEHVEWMLEIDDLKKETAAIKSRNKETLGRITRTIGILGIPDSAFFITVAAFTAVMIFLLRI